MTVGILGAGGMGNVHARQYRKMPDVELYFHDRDSEKALAFTERWQATPLKSTEDLISKADIVDVCLPTDLHVEVGLQAIASGKALFLEKPLGKTLEECEKLLAAATSAGTPLMVGHVVRFFPEFALGNRLVKEGKIGKPAAARTRRGGLAPKGSELWFMDHERSGGVLLDLAIHDFDWLRWTLGEVSVLTSRSLGAKTMRGPDYALTTLSFDSGAVAHVESTWMDPGGFRTTFEVAGSEGLIEFDSRTTPSLRATLTDARATEGPLSPIDDPYYKQLRSFVDAVSAGREPPVTGVDGMMSVSIALAALESAKQDGRPIKPARV